MIVEKPFGRDLESAQKLTEKLGAFLAERPAAQRRDVARSAGVARSIYGDGGASRIIFLLAIVADVVLHDANDVVVIHMCVGGLSLLPFGLQSSRLSA